MVDTDPMQPPPLESHFRVPECQKGTVADLLRVPGTKKGVKRQQVQDTVAEDGIPKKRKKTAEERIMEHRERRYRKKHGPDPKHWPKSWHNVQKVKAMENGTYIPGPDDSFVKEVEAKLQKKDAKRVKRLEKKRKRESNASNASNVGTPKRKKQKRKETFVPTGANGTRVETGKQSKKRLSTDGNETVGASSQQEVDIRLSKRIKTSPS